MQAKKISAEIQKLRDELSQVKEELRKEIHAVKQDSFQQAGPSRVQMYADVPPHQEAAPVPRYAQEPQARYAQDGPQGYPQQQWSQQAAPAQTWNQPYPPQMRGGDKPVETRPIDRNGVAPADVSVEKFFYMGNKK